MSEAVSSASGGALTARQLHDLLNLRVDVFVVEQECPYHEVDGRDLEPGTDHLWVEAGDGVAACLRIVTEGEHRRIGRVATRPDQRGRGLAARLVAAALDRTTGPVALDAQSYLEDWYAAFGFVRVGDEFVEDGIPHVPMRLDRPHD